MGCRDYQYFPYSRLHQRGQRIIDHRFVINREQLFADDAGNGIQTRTTSPGQDNAFSILFHRVNYHSLCVISAFHRFSPHNRELAGPFLGTLLLRTEYHHQQNRYPKPAWLVPVVVVLDSFGTRHHHLVADHRLHHREHQAFAFR